METFDRINQSTVISLPDGYNGDTALFYVEPLEEDTTSVKLRCAEPGKEYLIRWASKKEVNLKK